MRTPILFILLIALNGLTVAQEPIGELPARSYKGNIKSVEVSRKYLIYNGRSANERTERIELEEYDKDQRLIRYSRYGNVRQTSVFEYDSSSAKATIKYYDSDGRLLEEGERMFDPAATGFEMLGLCSDYSVRIEKDEPAGIERFIETCTNGNVRATRQDEYDDQGRLIRTARSDQRNRIWDLSYRYDSNNEISEFLYRSEGGHKPAFTWRVEYTSYQRDELSNVVSYLATAFHSCRPNEIAYQYFENYLINYY